MPRRLPMSALARSLTRPHGEEFRLVLAAGTLAVGDPITGSAGVHELGVTECFARYVELPASARDDESIEDEDAPTIGIRIRDTAVVRWEIGDVGGVDSGVFGVWDASRPPDDSPVPAETAMHGTTLVKGRPTFVAAAGDVGAGCVVGRDAGGAIAVLLAGPQIDAERFGIVEAKDIIVPTGELARLVASSAKTKRDRQLANAIAWGIERWRELLADVLPATAATLENLAVTPKKARYMPFPWMKPVDDAYTYDMSALRYDVTRELGDAATASTLNEIVPALHERAGTTALASLRTVPEANEDLLKAIDVVAKAISSTLELHALVRRRRGAGPTVEDRVASLEPASTLAARLR